MHKALWGRPLTSALSSSWPCPVTLHLTSFEGGNALSPFRQQHLRAQLQKIHRNISTVSARYLHWVASEQELKSGLQSRLAALLRYGEPAAQETGGVVLLVSPRLGTLSPWASR